MYLKQRDIFWGMSHDCVKKIMDSSRKESFEKGRILFEEGRPADRFYTLVKGRVRLSVRKTGQTVYTLNHAGEAFGWSSLFDQAVYSATAEIVEPTVLTFMEKEDLSTILAEHPNDGMIFYRHLARTLGNRLIQSYDLLAATIQESLSVSHGTGQVQEETAV